MYPQNENEAASLRHSKLRAYIFPKNTKICLRGFFQCLTSLNAKSNNFSEPVLQHLLNDYCKPYLLYGADVINWTESELSNLRCTLNSAMCKIYKVKFQLLDSIYKHTNHTDHRQKTFTLKLQSCSNLVIRHLRSVNVHSLYCLYCLSFIVHICFLFLLLPLF